MIYRQKYPILSPICDHTDHLTLWDLAKLFQGAADEHTALLNIGFEKLMENGQAWILSRLYYHIDRMPALGEEVTIATWSKGHDGLFAFRDFEMRDAEDKVVATGCSYWNVLNISSRRVVRLHDMLNEFEHHAIEATDRPKLSKVVVPTDISETERRNEFDVYYSSIDHNNHTNNSEYLRWVCDIIDRPEELKEIQIDYLGETRQGEHVEILRKDSDGRSCVQVRNPRGISVNCCVEY